MTRNEWYSVLKKAKALADGNDEGCFKMFDYLLRAFDETSHLCYRDYLNEEDEKDED